MIISVPELHSQPDFPTVDLTERNVGAVSLILSNLSLVEGMHKGSESVFPVFNTTHQVVAERFSDEWPDRLKAIDYGAKLFEAVSAVVDGSGAVQSISGVDVSIAMRTPEVMDWTTNSRKLAEMDVRDKFIQEMPNTKLAIAESAKRQFGPLIDYAITGAALDWFLVMRALEVSRQHS